MSRENHKNESQNLEHSSKLTIPAFEIDTNTAFMLHSNRDLSQIQQHMLSELNILNQKMDWTMETLKDMHEDLEDDKHQVTNLVTWKNDVDEWKEGCDKKIKEMDTVVSVIRDKKEKQEFLRKLISYVLTSAATIATSLGAIWLFLEKIVEIAK
jgi:CRISPR/Cas system-associated endonuclease/helicase Cas3